MRFIFSGLLALLTASPTLADTFQGREVIITDARGSNANPAPIIIAMHGFLGTAKSMQKKTNFDRTARRHNAVVVYPTGNKRRWNDGRSDSYKVDDVAYLSALIKTLVASGKANPSQIYLAGHSNGGGMAMRMACERPDLIAGIAVVATKMNTTYKCASARPVPAIFFHGTEDRIAPHDGRSGDSRLGETLSSEATIEHWVKRNKCNPIPRKRTINNKNDGVVVYESRYSACAAPVTYLELDGFGHDWPQGRQTKRIKAGKSTGAEVDASSAAARFFKGLR